MFTSEQFLELLPQKEIPNNTYGWVHENIIFGFTEIVGELPNHTKSYKSLPFFHNHVLQ